MAHILPPIPAAPTWHGVPFPVLAPIPVPGPRPVPVHVQIAMLRARMVARADLARAVDILRAIGATLRQAARWIAHIMAPEFGAAFPSL